MFNLDSLATSDTTDLHLKHPVSDELLYTDPGTKEGAVTVNLSGTSSKPYRAYISGMQNRALKRGKKLATAEQLREEGIELLVACSNFTTNISYQGKPLNDEASFRAIYSDPAFGWFKDQVDAGLGDLGAFLAA